MSERRGDWMQTATGRQFWPLDPRPNEVHIEDIAAALSKICRYGGHCLRFYSVAEHCVHVARAAPKEIRLAALLHDAAEAYVSDIIRPIKPYLPEYREMEHSVSLAIASRFNIGWPTHSEIKRLDLSLLATERNQVMAPTSDVWHLPEPPLSIKIGFWMPSKAERVFMETYFSAIGGAS